MSDPTKGVKAKVVMERFYFDEDMSGVTVSWKFTGVHTTKCPAPYNAYNPTGQKLTLYGMSYHQFNMNGQLLKKMTVFDNQHVVEVLGGKKTARW